MSSSSTRGDSEALSHDDVHVEIIWRAMTRITHQRAHQAKVDPRVNNPMTPTLASLRCQDLDGQTPPGCLLGPH